MYPNHKYADLSKAPKWKSNDGRARECLAIFLKPLAVSHLTHLTSHLTSSLNSKVSFPLESPDADGKRHLSHWTAHFFSMSSLPLNIYILVAIVILSIIFLLG